MRNPVRQQLLDEAVRLSHDMTVSGSRGEWAEVIELEARRSAILAQAFAEAVPADEATARQINTILEADKRLMNLSVEARDEAAVELANMQRGRKVQRAYSNAGI
jgi:hypothetical protein